MITEVLSICVKGLLLLLKALLVLPHIWIIALLSWRCHGGRGGSGRFPLLNPRILNHLYIVVNAVFAFLQNPSIRFAVALLYLLKCQLTCIGVGLLCTQVDILFTLPSFYHFTLLCWKGLSWTILVPFTLKKPSDLRRINEPVCLRRHLWPVVEYLPFYYRQSHKSI